MITRIAFATTLLCAVLLSACSAHTVRIADLKNQPGKYDDKTVSVSGVVTSSWGVPLLPVQFYSVDDGSGEITVVSRENRPPSRGARLKVSGRLTEVASIGGTSVGLHIDERDRHTQ